MSGCSTAPGRICSQTVLEQNISVIGGIFKIIGGFFAFAAALCTFLAVLQNDKHERTREWFRKKWEKISQNRWLEMPETIIKAILRAKQKFTIFLFDFKNARIYIVFLGTSILFILGTWIYLGIYFAALAIFLSFPLIVLALQEASFSKNSLFIRMFDLLQSIPEVLIITLVSIPFFGAGIFWILIALNTELLFSFLSMLVAIPCFFLLFIFPALLFRELFDIEFDEDKVYGILITLGVSVGISFSITFLSFLFGNVVSPESSIPRTFQMLASNVLLDGITMLITFWILAWAIKNKTLWRIPIAIFLDIIVAAVLACASLYLGLLGSENHLSLGQVFGVLIGKSPSQSGYELGPYFWAMHTTFIPTIIYLSIILVSWMAKIIFTSAAGYLGAWQKHNNPMALTAALFTLLAATMFVFAGLVTL